MKASNPLSYRALALLALPLAGALLAFFYQSRITAQEDTALLAGVCGFTCGVAILPALFFLFTPESAADVLRQKFSITRAKLVLTAFVVFICDVYILYSNNLMPSAKQGDFLLLLPPVLGCACAGGLIGIGWFCFPARRLRKAAAQEGAQPDRPGVPDFLLIFAAVGLTATFIGTTDWENTSLFAVLSVFALVFYLTFSAFDFVYTAVRLSVQNHQALPGRAWFLPLAAALLGVLGGMSAPRQDSVACALLAAPLGGFSLAALVRTLSVANRASAHTSLKAFGFWMPFFDGLVWALGTNILPVPLRLFGGGKETPAAWLLAGVPVSITLMLLLRIIIQRLQHSHSKEDIT